MILSQILLFNKWKRDNYSIYLSLFLLIVGIYGITHYFIVDAASPFWFAIFYNHFTPLMLLFGPLLLFYVRGDLHQSAALSRADIIHFFPALIQLVGISFYIEKPFEYKLQIARQIIGNIDCLYDVNNNYFFSPSINFIIRPLLLLCYTVYCLYLIWEKYSAFKNMNKFLCRGLLINFRWLAFLTISFIYISLYFLVLSVDSILENPSASVSNSYPFYILCGVVYFILSLSLLLFPTVLYGIPLKNSIENRKYGNKSINGEYQKPIQDNTLFDLSNKIEKYLNDETPFLKKDFSITDISLHLKVSQKDVSHCISEVLLTKFSTLKADLRIDYSMKLLSSEVRKSYTFEGIAEKSGFSTRASFYSAFKERTGSTPSEFIKKLDA